MREIEPLRAAGCDEFFAGLFSRRLDLNCRPATLKYNLRNLEELDAAVCQAAPCPLYLALNEPCEADSLPDFLALIDQARRLGVSGFIVSDLPLLEKLRHDRVDCGRISLSCLAGPFNAEAIRFYLPLEPQRIILPRQISLREMSCLTAEFPALEFEAFGFFDQCNAQDNFCRALDTIHGREKKADLGRECLCLLAADHRLVDPVGGMEEHFPQLQRFQAWYPGCAACALPALQAVGIHSLKLASRGWPLEMKLEAVRQIRRLSAKKDSGREETRQAFRRIFGRPCGPGDCYHKQTGAAGDEEWDH